MSRARPKGNIDPGMAALITLFCPGLGHLCQGRVIGGMFWFCSVLLLHLLFFWLMFIPGLIWHFVAVVSAARY